MKTYLVEKSNQLLELLSAKEISQRLEEGQLNPALRVYDDVHGGWIRFFDHPTFQRKAEVEHAAAIRGGSAASWPDGSHGRRTQNKIQLVPAMAAEWYYLQGQSPVGAFTYIEMIGMLQRKQISLSSVVWKRGKLNWAQASSLDEFQSTIIQQLREASVPGLEDYFAKRQFKRFPYTAKFILHDEDKLWRAVSFELSSGGIGLLANTDLLRLGQEVFVHKTSRGAEVDINAVAAIRSKFTEGMQQGQAKYGLEFVDISKDTQLEIDRFASGLLKRLK